jgi:hypothetical protein
MTHKLRPTIDENERLGRRYAEHYARYMNDVLPDIFEHLLRNGSMASMARAIRVCQAWAAAGIPVLWRAVDDRRLRALTDASRRQFYASVVRTIWLHRPTHYSGDVAKSNDNDDYFRDLRFPRLLHAVVDRCVDFDNLPVAIDFNPFL